MTKLEKLAEIEGYDNEMDMLQESVIDSVVPGICINKDCDYTCHVEPDAATGYCEECGTNTVASALILAKVI